LPERKFNASEGLGPQASRQAQVIYDTTASSLGMPEGTKPAVQIATIVGELAMLSTLAQDPNANQDELRSKLLAAAKRLEAVSHLIPVMAMEKVVSGSAAKK
jgi:hypothetical protein